MTLGRPEHAALGRECPAEQHLELNAPTAARVVGPDLGAELPRGGADQVEHDVRRSVVRVRVRQRLLGQGVPPIDGTPPK
jgi:hypothetical protein